MGNDFDMDMSVETNMKKKSKLLTVGIVAGILLLIIIIIFLVISSPKVLMGTLIAKTPDVVTGFFDMGKVEQPLYMTEPHESKTKITLDGKDLSMEDDLELEFYTGYQNKTGDLLANMEIGLGDLDAITLDVLLSENEYAIISSMLNEDYVIELELEDDVWIDKTLGERYLQSYQAHQDVDINELKIKLIEKLAEYSSFAIKKLPSKSIEKGKDNLEIFGNDGMVSFVEFELDEDEFNEWAEVILEKASEDKELEQLIIDFQDANVNTSVNSVMNSYFTAMYGFNMSDYDTDEEDEEFDIEDYCDDLLDEIEDLDIETTLRIYYKGFTPLAYEVKYDDGYSKSDVLILMSKSGKKSEMRIDGDIDGDEIYLDYYEEKDNKVLLNFEFDGFECEITAEKIEGIYEIDGDFKSEDGIDGKIKGEFEETKNETVFEIDYEYVDTYDYEYEIKLEGSIIKDSSVKTGEFQIEVIEDNEGLFELELELTNEEIKKNKEYETKGEFKITNDNINQEVVIEFENTMLYGEEVEVDLPKVSKDAVTAKASDEEEMEEFFNDFTEDWTTGISDMFSMLYYGGMY